MSSEVCSFMGLAGYYRWFVEGFSKIENPITKLQKKNKKFVWTEKCAEVISETQGVVDNGTDTKGPWHGFRLIGMHWHIQGLRQSLDARQSSDHLHLEEVEKAWGELHDAWFRVVIHCICLEILETLPYWMEIQTKNRPLWTTTHLYAKRLEHAKVTLVGIA
jgi:hypothetical protein